MYSKRKPIKSTRTWLRRFSSFNFPTLKSNGPSHGSSGFKTDPGDRLLLAIQFPSMHTTFPPNVFVFRDCTTHPAKALIRFHLSDFVNALHHTRGGGMLHIVRPSVHLVTLSSQLEGGRKHCNGKIIGENVIHSIPT
jgi:hypothetical protein